MNKLILTAIAVVALSGMLLAQGTNSTKNALGYLIKVVEKAAAITFEKTIIEAGKIPQNVPLKLNYTFTNTGNAPLVITEVQPSCGCTNKDFTKESIAPGKSGFISLTYNAASIGTFSKSATVTSNANPAVMTIEFNGEVVAATKTGGN